MILANDGKLLGINSFKCFSKCLVNDQIVYSLCIWIFYNLTCLLIIKKNYEGYEIIILLYYSFLAQGIHDEIL